MQKGLVIPAKYRRTYESALRLSENPDFHRAFNELLRSPDLMHKASADVVRYCKSMAFEY